MAGVLMMALASAAAAGQHAEPAARADGRALAGQVADRVDALYVVDEVRPKLVAKLRASAAAGRYDGLTPDALAQRVTEDMAAVAQDKHLGVSHSPQQAAMLGHQSVGDDEVTPDMAAFMRRLNHGVRELKTLDGNIRYMAYDGFAYTGPDSDRAIETAMRFLEGGDAAVIDLRRNGGGDPRAVALLASYFMDTGQPLARFEMRGRPSPPNATRAVPTSLKGKPLYVLTSPRSASAAEEFATHVSAFGFGTLVGGTTAGAAYRNDLVALPGGYVLSVSVGRPVHAKTGGDWERVGVKPALAVDPDRALDRALAHAHAKLATGAQGFTANEHARLGRFHAAKAEPVTPALALAAYAGRYGERTVAVADGRLTIQRNGGPVTPLVATAPDRFAMEMDPGTEVRFETAGGAVTGMIVERGDGRTEQARRG